MKTIRLVTSISAALLVAGALRPLLAEEPTAAPRMAGDYVEARTCNVYTGACHANGELLTAGKEAVLAWQVQTGQYEGTDLSRLNAMAVLVSKDNLAAAGAKRSSLLFVDSRATPAQRTALADALRREYHAELGNVLDVRSAPVEFSRAGRDVTVRVPGVAYLKTTAFGCNHCVMQHQLWYSPFVALKSALVGMASVNEFKGDPALSTTWRQEGENSSFVGEFTF